MLKILHWKTFDYFWTLVRFHWWSWLRTSLSFSTIGDCGVIGLEVLLFLTFYYIWLIITSLLILAGLRNVCWRLFLYYVKIYSPYKLFSLFIEFPHIIIKFSLLVSFIQLPTFFMLLGGLSEGCVCYVFAYWYLLLWLYCSSDYADEY